MSTRDIFLGNTKLKNGLKEVGGELISFENEEYYKISNSDAMRPFFMSIVSDSNHWMFMSSNGALTAGRKNAEYALFPYYTDDKITEAAEITGSKTILRIEKGEETHVWEPLSIRNEGRYTITRNLYKNHFGNKIWFEEINHDLNISFRYGWSSSNAYGFVRKAVLTNHADTEIRISILDGIQNILPYGVGSDIQNKSSNLVDAYKRSELIKESGLGIYALSAMIVDRAEPSEALKANVAWSLGLDGARHLLSSQQLHNFREGNATKPEDDIKAEKGGYFINTELLLAPEAKKDWLVIANVNLNHSAIVKLSHAIKHEEDLHQKVAADVALGTKNLIDLVAASDGLQRSSDRLSDARHFSNTLFNIMRGGIFDENYQIEKKDFENYLSKANKMVFQNQETALGRLPEVFSIFHLRTIAHSSDDLDFQRLCLEYMPLKFSRRHGDPSRPWNRFSINTHNELNGSKILDYEGNWRDIFQNWEALAHSYPDFVECMVHKFLNATTFDGYNPYRITKAGFDWEVIEPDDPWSYIGYWGDHQIIYLLKLLEFQYDHEPEEFGRYFDDQVFVYAHVPYKIKDYQSILENPKDTILFDERLDWVIRRRREEMGADGALLQDAQGHVHRANFIEKILATVLAKISNFIPEGGIWMNTQRPEWNDANNALVGNGVSMVTLYYLRRFLKFFQTVLNSNKTKAVKVSKEVLNLFLSVKNILIQNQELLTTEIDNRYRKLMMDALGASSSQFRNTIYEKGFSGERAVLQVDQLKQFVNVGLVYLEQSITVNKREDGLYHAYNLINIENKEEASIAHLSEMLEGQVAVLSSGFLFAEEALDVLDGLKNSKLFRDDQHSYLLYPNKELPRFTEKNIIPEEMVERSELLRALMLLNNAEIIEQDINGDYHFNGDFKNTGDLEVALEAIHPQFGALVEHESPYVLQVFEAVFHHKAFTGRSGTFYGYEGLGSIYWHMVSKLRLAVIECCQMAIGQNSGDETLGRLLEHYYEINEGIGVHKPPALYGAFPTDPYSHTPMGKGAQQPGMTGQVKEDILSRFLELGVFVRAGRLHFQPNFLRKEEFLQDSGTFDYVDVKGNHNQLVLTEGSLCFTYGQVPVVYKLGHEEKIEVVHKDRSTEVFKGSNLNAETSKMLFQRTGDIQQIQVWLHQARLK